MDLNLQGRRALILGASKGLGFASAAALAREGADVAIASSSLERCKEAADHITAQSGRTATPLLGDVSDPENMNRLHASAADALGGIDILVNNHGGPPQGLAKELSEDDLTREFSRMVLSIVRMTSLCFPAMVSQGWGRILFIGSAGMIQPIPNLALSNVLRSSIVGYCKTLATELAPDNVTVNILAPGSILTERTRSTNEANARQRGITVDEAMSDRVKQIPAGRLGQSEEFGAMAAFLCGEQASYMTGSIWRVDGGAIRSIV